MKVAINATNRQEADAIRAAMEDPKTRAYVIIMGTLRQLPSDEDRRRVLAFVSESQAGGQP